MRNTLVLFTYLDVRTTQHLRFKASFRPEDHTDWEGPSFDLQSWESLDYNENLTIFFTIFTTHLPQVFSLMWQFFSLFFLINGPRQANLVLIAYASSEGSGEPAHPRSLARTSAARSYKQWVKRNLRTESQIPGPSEWLGMRS